MGSGICLLRSGICLFGNGIGLGSWSGFGPIGLNKRGYLLGLTHDFDHFNRDWAFSSMGPGTEVVGGTKCGIHNS